MYSSQSQECCLRGGDGRSLTNSVTAMYALLRRCADSCSKSYLILTAFFYFFFFHNCLGNLQRMSGRGQFLPFSLGVGRGQSASDGMPGADNGNSLEPGIRNRSRGFFCDLPLGRGRFDKRARTPSPVYNVANMPSESRPGFGAGVPTPLPGRPSVSKKTKGGAEDAAELLEQDDDIFADADGDTSSSSPGVKGCSKAQDWRAPRPSGRQTIGQREVVGRATLFQAVITQQYTGTEWSCSICNLECGVDHDCNTIIFCIDCKFGMPPHTHTRARAHYTECWFLFFVSLFW